jgi:hypothetical protein
LFECWINCFSWQPWVWWPQIYLLVINKNNKSAFFAKFIFP